MYSIRHRVRMLVAAAALLVGATALVPAFALAHSSDKTHRGQPTASEVIITDGIALVRNATVTAVSGPTVTAVTEWGARTWTWTVTTDAHTKFHSHKGSAQSITGVVVGQRVSFAGPLTGSGMTVEADAFKVLTTATSSASLMGSVVSIATTSNSFALSRPNHGTTTVQLAGGTVITNTNGATTTLAALAAGDRVKVIGVWNATKTVLAASKVSILPQSNVGIDQKRYESMLKRWLSGHAWVMR